ncbi:uncharacterized protein TNCV_4550601 [Trichonephila clavipes]|nr:uncharacterized protein TNCV_4550601 [Trichonephila clavipes]
MFQAKLKQKRTSEHQNRESKGNVGIMLTGDAQCLVTNPASNCVLTIIENMSGDVQNSVPILLSQLHATQALNQKLWSGEPFLLTAGSVWSSLEATCSRAIRR